MNEIEREFGYKKRIKSNYRIKDGHKVYFYENGYREYERGPWSTSGGGMKVERIPGFGNCVRFVEVDTYKYISLITKTFHIDTTSKYPSDYSRVCSTSDGEHSRRSYTITVAELQALGIRFYHIDTIQETEHQSPFFIFKPFLNKPIERFPIYDIYQLYSEFYFP